MTSRTAFLLGSACSLLVAACASQSSQKPPFSVPPTEKAAPVDAFAVVRVDDTVDPLADVTDARLPAGQGMAVFTERSMVSGGKIVEIHFVRTVLRNGETAPVACGRFLQWVHNASISLPSTDRWGCQVVLEYDAMSKTSSAVGVRSYVLTGDSVITQRDVTDAYVGDDKSDEDDFLDVAVKLSSAGRAKLKAATADWIHRRLAVLADGMVSIAPLVKGEIDTGTLTIAFGKRTPAELDRAQAYVSRILGK